MPSYYYGSAYICIVFVDNISKVCIRNTIVSANGYTVNAAQRKILHKVRGQISRSVIMQHPCRIGDEKVVPRDD